MANLAERAVSRSIGRLLPVRRRVDSADWYRGNAGSVWLGHTDLGWLADSPARRLRTRYLMEVERRGRRGSPPGDGSVRPKRCTIWRRYEALRSYLFEGRTAAEVAQAFGYPVQTLHSMVRDLRSGRREFFVSSRPGPRRAPGKERAHDRIVELRAAGHSIDEFAHALVCEGTVLTFFAHDADTTTSPTPTPTCERPSRLAR